LSYSDPLQRRARAARRLFYAAAQPRMRGKGAVVATFWWDGHPNFGDDLTPWLLPRYGILPVYRRPASARLAGVGSILEFLPPDFDGAIWGSGLMEGAERPLPDAHVLAVRGPLTAERIGVRGAVAFGDPGLLVGRQLPRPRLRWEIGVVPHGHHRQHEALAALCAGGGDRVRVVNVHQGAAAAAGEIAACRTVFTTSLHGLVIADAYGIPAAWTTLEPPLNGGDFKFRDYEAAITPHGSRYLAMSEVESLDDVTRRARRVDADTVTEAARRLEEALARLAAELGPLPRFPGGIRSAVRS
jgi:hypothetical protein